MRLSYPCPGVLGTSNDSGPRRAWLAALAGLALLAVSAPAGATTVKQSPSEVYEYWTDERIEAALPGDALLAGVTPAALPEGLSLGLAPTPAERAAPASRATAQTVSKPRRRPLRTHGKVYFRQGGLDYVCSGTVIKSRTRSLVITAGHCVYSGLGGFAQNFMFVPAKRGGKEPFGRWAARKLATTPQWRSREDIRYDVGMATMAKRGGKKIQQVVGARGIAFDRRGNQRFRAFGYPAAGRFDGQTPYSCRATQEGRDRSQGQPAPNRIDCDMTGGSSGGGWVIRKGRVNSVVSYGYECTIIIFPCDNPEEGKLFGPYFGGQIRELYNSQRR